MMEIYIYILNISIYINLLFCLTMSSVQTMSSIVQSSLQLGPPPLVRAVQGYKKDWSTKSIILFNIGFLLEHHGELYTCIVRYLRTQDSPPDDFFSALEDYWHIIKHHLKNLDDVRALLDQIMSF